MKFIIALLSLAVVGVLGYFGYNYYLSVRQPSTETSATAPLPGFQNPFDDKPTTSFGLTNAPTPTPVNPFAQPTQGYQNPFSSTPAGSQEYQNPFEALR
ncbi:hypothetical protein HY339_01935 [Candidatus Gottesmanbacteria bacterium]|nr:hypothetical protein [Candidatus Gottesmanbacteria bacterium]